MRSTRQHNRLGDMLPTFPPPTSPADLIRGFAFYYAAAGVRSIADRFEFTGAPRRSVVYAATGRTTETAPSFPTDVPYRPRVHFTKLIESAGFQAQLLEYVLRAFPEKRRMLFVHIPKCAGTDLETALQRRVPLLHHHMTVPGITPTAALFAALRTVALSLPFAPALAVSGHLPLRWYVEQDLIRYGDDLFTIVRSPRDIVYSQVSYILTRFVQFAGTVRHDTTGWLRAIGETEFEPDPTPERLVETGRRLLRSAVPGNLLSTYLGAGTAQSAFELCAATDIELTDTQRYSEWRMSRFGLGESRRSNESRKLFTPDHADAADRAFVETLVARDLPLWDAIQRRLDARGGLSIRGSALA